MVQKAKLDIMENLPDIEIEQPVGLPEAAASDIAAGKGEAWAFNKLLMILAPIAVAVAIIGASLWFLIAKVIYKPSPERVGTEVVEVTPLQPLAELKIAYVKDFIIDIKDKNGKNKILICDVAFDVSENNFIKELETRTDVRAIIYRMAKSKTATTLKSVEDRLRFKKELAEVMKKMLGENTVNNIYFINYVII